MNILKEYTLDYVRRNKKSSLAIMIAILIATTMLSALTGALYTFYTDELRFIIAEKGNWHAELFDNTPGDKLKYVTGHPNVDSVMLKGTWKIAEIDDPRRPYLAMRGLNAKYWNDMPEHTAILEGRAPRSENELAVSKQYFENHPGLAVGDSITLSLGARVLNGEAMDFVAPFKKGELFVPDDERTFAIVAKLDITTNSMTPYYMAYGYLDEAGILPDDQLTVYMRFKNPRSTYEDINKIAQSVGLAPDEYGDYMVKTNDILLAKYLIFSPEQRTNFSLWMFSQPLMLAAFALLAAGVFVFIIHNAFAMSANSRLKQLGMLQSIGASPKQILRSVVFEGLILSLLPIPAGLFVGWALDYGLFAYINSVENLRNATDIVFTYGLPAALPSVVLALLTVWLSALLPARKISRLTPIEAIRQGGDIKVKKLKKSRFASKAFGIEGELAQNALQARRQSYRTASISLTLSFLLFSGFLNLMAVNDARNKVYYFDTSAGQKDISLYIQDGHMTEPEFENRIRSIAGIQSVLFASNVPAGLWLSPDMASDELRAIGGLKRIADSGKYSVYEENGMFRVSTSLITLDDRSFTEYCEQIGADPSMFFDAQTPYSIVVNEVQDDVHSSLRNDIRIPFLKLNVGDSLKEEEKIYTEDTGTYSFTTKIGFLTNQTPDTGERYGGYQLLQVMPRSVYSGIVGNFQETRFLKANSVFAPVTAQSEAYIQPVADEIQDICDNWYGSGDYSIRNILEVRKTDANARNLLKTVMLCAAGFLALIGISNVFSTVSGNLRQRQKEFAMLRSIGIPPKGVRRMLILEAILLGLMPVLLGIPLNVLAAGVFLKINRIYLSEFLPFLPVLPILAFGAAILLSVVLAYVMGWRMLQRSSIVDVLKEDAV